MKLAVLSDIHGNMEAFRQVLADVERLGLKEMICLGDCIGYGPDPEMVIAEIRRRNIPTVLGNHEMAVVDPAHLDWFNPKARISLEKTLTMLSDASMAFIKTLPYSRIVSGARFVHGYPPDSARTYLFQKTAPALRTTFEEMAESICFLGHTHQLELIRYDGRQVERYPLREGTTCFDPGCRYMVNVGSVGQPRDGTNQAKYAIWDREGGCIEVRFIPYDIAATVSRIRAAGLPEAHAERLW